MITKVKKSKKSYYGVNKRKTKIVKVHNLLLK